MSNEYLIEETFDSLNRQLNSFWRTNLIEQDIAVYIDNAIEKTKKSFDASNRPHYLKNGFSVLNTCVYSVFLYHMSHDIAGDGCDENRCKLADKLYYLNKIMNCVDWYWNISLPEHFIVDHPLGSVLGRAKYGDYFSIYQGVTVGESLKKDEVALPTLGHHVIMFSDSKIIGKCNIGNYVILSANSCVINTHIPDCSIVYGKGKDIKIRTMDIEEILPYYSRSWIAEQTNKSPN